MAEVLVRVETPILGLAIRSEVVLERSPLVDAAIAQERLIVLQEFVSAAELAAEAALDQGDVDDEPVDEPAGEPEVAEEAPVGELDEDELDATEA